MPTKELGPGEFNEIDRFEGGFGWIAHPEETMERASHALATDDGVYVVDPVDAAGLDAHLAELGEVAGVVVLLAYHTRHAADIARRHDVPVYLPTWLTGVDVDAPSERFTGELGESGYHLLPVTVNPVWKEGALWDGETLVVAESLGAADYFLVGEEPLGVSHMRRPFPPTAAFGDLSPERILLGHGEGVLEDATRTLDAALANARPSALPFYRENGTTMLRTLKAALTT